MNAQAGPDYVVCLDGVIRPVRSNVERIAEAEIVREEMARAIAKAKRRLLRQRRPWFLRLLP